MDLLEQQLSDQRAMSKRTERRLDDLQIQVTLLARRLDGRRSSARPAAVPEAADTPELKVVRLSPPALVLRQDGSQTGRQVKRRAPKRRKAWKLTETKLDEVDPAEVTERLPVDRAAAKRQLSGPVMRLSVADDEPEPTTVAAQAPDPEDALAAKAFSQAFQLYRSNDFGAAARALAAFAGRYPDHPMAGDSLYYAGKAQLMIGQNGRAERHFVELARSFPEGKYSAEALLLAGRCQEKLGHDNKARGTYLQLVDAFPLTKQAGEANQRLRSIR
jgi:TolA-binding protein